MQQMYETYHLLYPYKLIWQSLYCALVYVIIIPSNIYSRDNFYFNPTVKLDHSLESIRTLVFLGYCLCLLANKLFHTHLISLDPLNIRFDLFPSESYKISRIIIFALSYSFLDYFQPYRIFMSIYLKFYPYLNIT